MPEQLPIHDQIYEKLDHFYKSNKIPHLIFHGSSGTGKRTIVNNFITKIYGGDRQKIKMNVMFVNCAHGKGIKFIREELKFFAKTNVQSNNGIIFKTIVLINAEYLTIDAQSALRRCIELFSYNTRFFIIVENKQKLLNPILSRFCEIYVPEYVDENTNIINLHKMAICRNFNTELPEYMVSVTEIMENLIVEQELTHNIFLIVAAELYENALTSIDLVNWVKTEKSYFSSLEKAQLCMYFEKIKSEYRSEKLLILNLLDFMFLRLDKDLQNIESI
jgi:DNA polymerase III delta prime subunit